MTGVVRVNADVLRQRLLDLGLSARAFAALTGIGQATVKSMTHDGQAAGDLTAAALRRVLDESGLTAAQLLDVPDLPSDQGTPGDAALLAGALLGDARMHPRERLAAALGWTLSRVEQAIASLDAAVAPAGMTVHVNSMGVALRASSNAADDAVRRLADLRDHDEGLDQSAARVLWRALDGGVATADLRRGDRPQAAALHRQGTVVIEAGSTLAGGRIRLSPAAAYAFAVD